MTAGHTDVRFKEVEINRRSIAVHAVIQQYRLTFYIKAAVVRHPCIQTIYKKEDIKYKARVIYIKIDGSYLQHKVYIYIQVN